MASPMPRAAPGTSATRSRGARTPALLDLGTGTLNHLTDNMYTCRARGGGAMDVPRIISVDDHVLEPPHLWQRYLPARFRDEGPRLVRAKGRIAGRGGWQETDEGGWADIWRYQGYEMAIIP